ncbi:MAG: bifunctional lysylphosphatidylglycerol flippase/synthetase MprF [Pseudoxanthomonas sp.]
MRLSLRRFSQVWTHQLLQHGARWKTLGLVAGVLVLLVLVSEAFHGFWTQIHYAAVVAAMRATPWQQLALALAATAISFASLTGYDASSLRYVGAKVRYPIVAKASFIAYALANTIGLGVFTGGAVRMRLYGAAGVEPGTITKAIAFNALAFGLGISVVGAVGLMVDARALAPVLHLPASVLMAVGGTALLVTLWLLLMCHKGQARVGRWTVNLPTPALAWGQLALSALDILATGAVLWFLLPAGTIDFMTFIGFFAAAMVAGVISHVPGGLGVFEAVMLVALGGRISPEALASALVLYRIVYFLLPLLLALLVLVSHEVGATTSTPVARAVASLAPRLLAAFTLVVAVMLLVSGVTPSTVEAIQLLSLSVPLPLVEASHFLSSIIGVVLLFVARALLRRLDAAWWAALVMTVVALILALPKGVALTEFLLLAALTLALAFSHKQFNRRASLLAVPFSGGWLLAMAAICVAVTGLLFFSYQDVDYRQQLWWRFEFDAEAPRSLRAMVAIAILMLAIAIRQLLRRHPPVLSLPAAPELASAAEIVRAGDTADAGLALTGDKHLLFSDSGKAFLSFGRKGRSWVVLGDPVGPREEWTELVWRFLEQARDAGARGCFYQVRPESLTLYLDAGLRLFKLGEYAYVPLGDFTLQGKRRQNLRTAVNRAEREGMTFALVEPDMVQALLPELRTVSDAWLSRHKTAEKRFSVGAFVDGYIVRNPVAIVRKDDKVIAFASLLSTATGQEASVDLMRHVDDMPNGTMDFLFAKLMLHFAALGYQRFGLGMAPLSGMAGHALAPKWHRLGRMLFSHGENFYNFRGLRSFKEKFDPRWEARYLASPGGITPLFTLADIAALISGGYKGVISK